MYMRLESIDRKVYRTQNDVEIHANRIMVCGFI